MKDFMKRTLSMIVIAIMTIIATSCKKNMTPNELLDKCGSGVVMIINQYYFRVQFPTGKVWYFTGFDKDGDMENLSFNVSEIMKNRNTITGTGFFVSEDGKILTNRHVVQPAIDISNTKHSMRNVFNALRQLIDKQMQEYSYQYDALENEKNNCYSYDYDGNIYADEDRLAKINSQQSELSDNYQQCKDMKDQLDDIDISEIRVEPVCELGIAYNNTFMTKISDFKPSVTIAVSDKDEIDLALIQLKDKHTPSSAFIFDTSKEASDVEVGDNLCMIGFNAGFSVSNTSQGIKAQITSGQISQNSDANKMLYTIPSLPGSSGSPVINTFGELMAVNFAGFTGTQSFNYGIKYSKVKAFVDNNI